MPEQAFGSHDNHRSFGSPERLAAEQMKVLRGSSWVGDPHVALGAEL